MSAPITPCIWLDDQAEAAAAWYCSVFAPASVVAVGRYPEGTANPSGKPPGSVVTVEVELAGQRFTLLNGGPIFKPNPTVSFFVRADTAAEVDRLHAALSDGGFELMPLDAYPWSPRYAWVQDRYGVSWQLIAGRRDIGPATIVPCLMFAGAQHGRAAEAIDLYTRIFPGSEVLGLEHYAAGEGPEGTVKHGRFTLSGQEFVAMDAHVTHGLQFDEGVSLQVPCADQAEIDRLWAGLSDGGAPGPCGWLQDRFGLSWQVTPQALATWMSSTDKSASARVYAAVMGMGKLDLAALQHAFDSSLG